VIKSLVGIIAEPAELVTSFLFNELEGAFAVNRTSFAPLSG